MSDTHSKIIAAAARVELGPLGFRQKGRSRLWLADHGSWLNLVEFTPDRWSKGVNLANAAHWLWLGAGFMSFNESVQSGCHAEFENEDQFRSAAIRIAKVARANALEIEARFPTFEAIAAFVVDRARGDPDRMGPSWWGYEAGIASGLVGWFQNAEHFLRGVTDERVVGRAEAFLPLLDDPSAFRKRVNDLVAQQRAKLKLSPMECGPF